MTVSKTTNLLHGVEGWPTAKKQQQQQHRDGGCGRNDYGNFLVGDTRRLARYDGVVENNMLMYSMVHPPAAVVPWICEASLCARCRGPPQGRAQQPRPF